MRLHRFFHDIPFTSTEPSITDKEFANQVRNVLRLQPGDRLLIANSTAKEAVSELLSVQGNTVRVRIQEVRTNTREPARTGILYCAILKRENFELVCQKAIEIGINGIVPLVTERTVKLEIKKERVQKIMKEAAEQSGRAHVPTLQNPMHFTEALLSSKTNDLNILFDETGNALPARSPQSRIGIFIGPEGGWSANEIIAARTHGLKITTLAPLTLRAETAALLASFAALYQ